ncbi:MAG: acyl-CoA thioesterase [Gemmatimonadota bacterium]|nr:acyl-CoA thioesterase [Gemmatimonadota bacterium]MDH4347692.1 acyl-CoA thioesterase [Gemmatimonadota bacterium]
MHQPPDESVTTVRVNYSETDQMGVVYHARHVVWLDIARTEHLRLAGYSYRDLEASGIRLVVTDLKIRYRNAARYDDVVRIRCRVQDAGSRRVTFAYHLQHAETGMAIADAETTLISLDAEHRLTRLPRAIVEALGGVARPAS